MSVRTLSVEGLCCERESQNDEDPFTVVIV